MKICDLLESDDFHQKILLQYVESPSSTNKHLLQNNWDTLIDHYPNDDSIVYRGLNFNTEESYNKFVNSLPTVTTDTITSWTSSYDEALVFASIAPQNLEQMSLDKAISIYNKEKEKEKISGFAGVIISMRVEKGQGIDIGKSKVSLEDEILLPSGTYKVAHNIIQSYKNEIATSDINNIVHNEPIDNSKAKYILLNRHDELSTESFKKLFDVLWFEPKFNITVKYNIVTETHDVNLIMKFPDFVFKYRTLFPETIQKIVNKNVRNFIEDVNTEHKAITGSLSNYDNIGFNAFRYIQKNIGR